MAKTKVCRECKAEIPKSARKCMHCGSKQGAGTLGWIFAILLLIFIVKCSLDMPTTTNTQPTLKSSSQNTAQHFFRQVGYLKDGSRNRIFTIAFKKSTPKSSIQTFATQRMNTPGQITAVYFYPEGSTIPADGVTLAGSVFQANKVLYNVKGLSKWRYAYMKGFNGSENFVDCKKTPTNDLCRK